MVETVPVCPAEATHDRAPALDPEPYMLVGSRERKMIRLGYHLEDDLQLLTLREIATSLSRICRYNGHGSRFYSVLEHTLHLTRWCSDHGNENCAPAALLHDAHEVVVGDAIFPLRHVRSESWIDLKHRVDRTLFERFVPQTTLGHRLLVDRWDRQITADEISALWPTDDTSLTSVLPDRLGVEILSRLTPDPEVLVGHFLGLAEYFGIEGELSQ